MSALSRLSRDSIWLLISRVATQLGLALFTILLARGLGSTVFGEYAFIAAVIFIGNVLTTFGTDMLLIREIAASDDITGLGPALWIQLLLSVVFIGLVTAASEVTHAGDPAAASALQIYSLSMIPLAFYSVFTTALRGRQRMRAYALLNLALMAVQLVAAAWLLWKRGGLIELAVLLLAAQGAAAVLAGVICAMQFRDLAKMWRTVPRQIPPMLRASAPIALLGLLGVIYQRLTLLLLPSLAGATATGWYSAGARMVEAAKIGHVAVLTALYPMMARYRDGDGSLWSRSFRIPGLVLIGGAAAATLSLYWLAGPLVAILFGAQYAASVPIVRILAWMLIPYAVNSFLSLAFLARGQEKAVVMALVLSTAVLAALVAWWTPAAGLSGAAWAALAAETTQAGVLLTMDIRQMHVMRDVLGGLWKMETEEGG